jgi:hypothetical protein
MMTFFPWHLQSGDVASYIVNLYETIRLHKFLLQHLMDKREDNKIIQVRDNLFYIKGINGNY